MIQKITPTFLYPSYPALNIHYARAYLEKAPEHTYSPERTRAQSSSDSAFSQILREEVSTDG